MNSGNEWEQVGPNIEGLAAGDNFGRVVSLSGDGSTVAAGANDANSSGQAASARVFKLNGNSWVQVGSDILGQVNGASGGTSISLSDDGTRVAVGAMEEAGTGTVRVFRLNGSSWEQVGSVMAGDDSGDRFGVDVSISDDGTVVAIGGRYNDANGSDAGQVKVFKQNGNLWEQFGDTMMGAAADQLGISVSLSADGTKVAMGTGSQSTGGIPGYCRVSEVVSC